jgi:superfamily I DNA and RNA helicase
MLNIVWGSNKDKPEAAKALADLLSTLVNDDGYLYIGYPVIGSPLGPVKCDALLLSRQHGLIAFDLVEGLELGDYENRLDDIASMLEVKLKPYPKLKTGRNLRFDITTITFAPAKKTLPDCEAPYICANRENLVQHIEKCTEIDDPELLTNLLAAIQVVTSIRSGKLKRGPKNQNSRGARLKKVEESIANLDQHQSRAVIETVDGIQLLALMEN